MTATVARRGAITAVHGFDSQPIRPAGSDPAETLTHWPARGIGDSHSSQSLSVSVHHRQWRAVRNSESGPWLQVDNESDFRTRIQVHQNWYRYPDHGFTGTGMLVTGKLPIFLRNKNCPESFWSESESSMNRETGVHWQLSLTFWIGKAQGNLSLAIWIIGSLYFRLKFRGPQSASDNNHSTRL